jgi:hydroxymethylpyrimidine pyrophosphatase-like HAD family hydrolase
MIEAAGVGIAMANASDVAKSVADYVTTLDNNHGGIAEIIGKYVI